MNINKAAIELLKGATSAESAANGLYELSRILLGEKTMKTIKDAVIELDGKLPRNTMQHGYAVVEGMLLDRRKSPVECYVCKVEEFEACAKRLGYINGYRWGVEYPTNGKRPDLPDDILVSVQHSGSVWMIDNDNVSAWTWSALTAFKITDPRYKPVSEISESKSDAEDVSEKLESNQSQPDVSDAERFGIMPPINKNERCDLNNWHERGELPPVGVECLALHGDDREWYKVEVLKRRTNESGVDVAAVMRLDTFKVFWCCEFKPLPAKSEREKVIEAAMSHSSKMITTQLDFATSLYEAGMLVLPPKKSDTED